MSLYAGDSFEFKHMGRRFRCVLERDDTRGAPWDECDGHGVVSDWTTRDKEPGEILLVSDGRGREKRYYDFAETTRIAKRDGWGLGDDDKAKLAARLGRVPTRKDIIREAVMRDFEYLRAWCNGEWGYVGAIVTEIDDNGDDMPGTASLWGIESESEDYIRGCVAIELAEECAARNGDLLRA